MKAISFSFSPRLITLFLLITLAFFLTGCTASKTQHSGYLNDYSELNPDPEFEGSMFYAKPDAELKKYTKFIIDPVTVYLPPEIKEDQRNIDAATVDKTTTYLKNALTKVIEENFKVVQKPGNDVARIRCAITGVQLQRKKLKAYNYIPISLVITAAGEASGVRDSLTVANMEAELLDSLTGNRVAAVVQKRSREVSVKDPKNVNENYIYPLLDYWAEKFKKRLNKIHGL